MESVEHTLNGDDMCLPCDDSAEDSLEIVDASSHMHHSFKALHVHLR